LGHRPPDGGRHGPGPRGGQPQDEDAVAMIEGARPPDPLIGQLIAGRYRVDELLATGGMGSVYLGEHVHIRKRVAIKVLDADTDNYAETVARFEREAIAGAHISHPNVVVATDFSELPDGTCFLVLEYVRGVTLHELLRHGPLPPARAVHIARQIAAALGEAH